MKKLLLMLMLATAFVGCGKKGDDPAPVETKQGVDLSFYKNRTLGTGEIVQDAFSMYIVLIWKADGRNFSKVTTATDFDYALDASSNTSIKYDMSYMNVTTKKIDLPAGSYFIRVITNSTDSPKIGYSSVPFTVTAGSYTVLKKNVSTMNNLTYTAW